MRSKRIRHSAGATATLRAEPATAPSGLSVSGAVLYVKGGSLRVRSWLLIGPHGSTPRRRVKSNRPPFAHPLDRGTQDLYALLAMGAMTAGVGLIERRTEPDYKVWAVEAVRDLEIATANRNDAFRLWNIHGASYRAIAEATGVPASTVALIVKAGANDERLPMTRPEDNRQHPEYGFERFWDRYPKRNNKRLHKADTLTVWRRMTYPEKAEAYAACEHYAKACDDGLFIAQDAHRWLRGKEWREWQTPAVADTQAEPRLTGTDRARPAAERYLARKGAD